jgi:hypothetical protein
MKYTEIKLKKNKHIITIRIYNTQLASNQKWPSGIKKMNAIYNKLCQFGMSYKVT